MVAHREEGPGSTGHRLDHVHVPLTPSAHSHRQGARVGGRDRPCLRAVPARSMDQDPPPTPCRAGCHLEAPVVLLEHEVIQRWVGSHEVPPDLVRPERVIDHRVEERPTVGCPGAPVVGSRDPLREVHSGGDVAEPQLVELLPRCVDRPCQDLATGTHLTHADLGVCGVQGGCLEVEIHQHAPLRGPLVAALELPELGSFWSDIPEDCCPTNMLGPLLGQRGPGHHLREQPTAQGLEHGGGLRIVRGLGPQVLTELWATGGHPGVVVLDLTSMQVPDVSVDGCLRWDGHGRRT